MPEMSFSFNIKYFKMYVILLLVVIIETSVWLAWFHYNGIDSEEVVLFES